MGYVSFFENFIQIVVLLFAWIVVLLAFFILAIQLFVTLIEFKLTTLAGFVLIPFGLFGKTAFAAERVLGNVISSGIKVLVLAVIVGIGSTLFSQFTVGFGGNQPIDRRRHGAGARRVVAAGPRNFRSRHRQRHRVRRSAARRRRGRRCGRCGGGVVAAECGSLARHGAAGGTPLARARGLRRRRRQRGGAPGGVGCRRRMPGAAAVTSPLAAPLQPQEQLGGNRAARAGQPALRQRRQPLIRRQPAGLGRAHEARANRQPWGFRRGPCRSLR